MKKQDLAKLLKISRPTLNQWEKEKPELMELVRLGLQSKKIKEQLKNLLNEMEEIENESK